MIGYQANVTNVKSYMTDLLEGDGVLLVSFHDLIESATALEAINRAGTQLATFWPRAQVEKVPSPLNLMSRNSIEC